LGPHAHIHTHTHSRSPTRCRPVAAPSFQRRPSFGCSVFPPPCLSATVSFCRSVFLSQCLSAAVRTFTLHSPIISHLSFHLLTSKPRPHQVRPIDTCVPNQSIKTIYIYKYIDLCGLFLFLLLLPPRATHRFCFSSFFKAVLLGLVAPVASCSYCSGESLRANKPIVSLLD